MRKAKFFLLLVLVAAAITILKTPSIGTHQDTCQEVKQDTTVYTTFDQLQNTLDNNKDKTVVAILTGTVIDDNGNGTDEDGYYTHYSSEFAKGDKVISYFTLRKGTTQTDDIETRKDTLNN